MFPFAKPLQLVSLHNILRKKFLKRIKMAVLYSINHESINILLKHLKSTKTKHKILKYYNDSHILITKLKPFDNSCKVWKYPSDHF